MRVAIMQPYFLPYIGYYQLIAAVDRFVVYDNIKYTKKGWINRNRILRNGSDTVFTLPLRKDSDSFDVMQRELSVDFDREKLLNQFRGAYSSAPYFKQTFPLLERIIRWHEQNLFRYIYQSILEMCTYLRISTEIVVSSDINVDHDLKAQEKVIALCKSLGARTYINPIGGLELYKRADFATQDIDLKFIKSRSVEYRQFGAPFVPWLSIVDVLMFNPSDTVCECIACNYDLV